MKNLLTLLFFCAYNALFAQLTFVPDDNFEALLEANGMGNNIANDNFVSTINIENVTTLNISASNITDLTGIEGFSALTELNCFENLLTDLDLSILPLLERVDASENLILNVNFTQNPNLEVISINENFLKNLDVSQNPSLVNLFVDSNLLTSINISQNPLLEKISCSNNRLTSLNAKNEANTNISTFVTLGNPDLICIQVDNATYSTTNWTNVDIVSSFNEDCSPVLNTSSIELNRLSLFPNPVSNILTINTELEDFEYSLYNIQGQKFIKSNSTISKTVNFNSYPPGLYILTISSNNQEQSFKIIKN